MIIGIASTSRCLPNSWFRKFQITGWSTTVCSEFWSCSVGLSFSGLELLDLGLESRSIWGATSKTVMHTDEAGFVDDGVSVVLGFTSWTSWIWISPDVVLKKDWMAERKRWYKVRQVPGSFSPMHGHFQNYWDYTVATE